VEFDVKAFYRAIDGVREERGLNWKQLAALLSVHASTFSRMAKGQKPDADSLATMSAWAGLNPADFVPGAKRKKSNPSTLATITTCLRGDPNLSEESIVAMEQMIRAAYRGMSKK
jgi:transcriptional regulator with XRE-family HTH domain